MRNIIFVFLLFTTIIFIACNKSNEEQHSEDNTVHEDHGSVNLVSLTHEQMSSINVELGKIEKKQLSSSLKANGFLKVPNQNKANATTIMGGVIKSIFIQTGNHVRRGQVIATISNNSFITMQEDLLSIASKLELAELEFERQKMLVEGNAGALKNLQAATTELNTLKSRKASLQKQLELIGINPETLTPDNIRSSVNVISPISGVISNIMVNIGSYVDAANPVAEIVDNSRLHLDLYVYEKDIKKLKVGQTIHFTLTNNPGREYDAYIYAISNTFEQNTKAIAVHARVKGDKQGLIDGMSVTALISLTDATVDAVPTDAIVNHEGQDYIFIVSGKKNETSHTEGTKEHEHDDHSHDQNSTDEHKEEVTTFEKIPVSKGTTDIGFSEITLLKEIPHDSKIVVNGAFYILAKMTNQGEAHAH
ncbi:MAG: membrane-fusion protein [Chlorobi bacterium OLB4]|jgi:RND family efflux transporter, MFP subunit|nr:MAG: membrane-fusion protein [Chlorobi bacterium OLB4]MBW7855553.1 efflux RND transporter periplasmic adaptor subunit [Ignavibacteria bacterium]OQY79034.1 MAG: efflux transporter periplasmic adaptor subunit [Ignavibacteriales bacterium UTCHB1]